MAHNRPFFDEMGIVSPPARTFLAQFPYFTLSVINLD